MADNQHLPTGGTQGPYLRGRSPVPTSTASTEITTVQAFGYQPTANTSQVSSFPLHDRLRQISQVAAASQAMISQLMSEIGNGPSMQPFLPPGSLPQNQIQWSQSQTIPTQINMSLANTGLSRPDKRPHDTMMAGYSTTDSSGRPRAVSAEPLKRVAYTAGTNASQGPTIIPAGPQSQFPQNSLLPVPPQVQGGPMPTGSSLSVPVYTNPPGSYTARAGLASPSNSQFAPNQSGQGGPATSTSTAAQRLPDWMRPEINAMVKAAQTAYTAEAERTLSDLKGLLTAQASQLAEYDESQRGLSAQVSKLKKGMTYLCQRMDDVMPDPEAESGPPDPDAPESLKAMVDRVVDEVKTLKEKVNAGTLLTTDQTIRRDGTNTDEDNRDLGRLGSLFGDEDN